MNNISVILIAFAYLFKFGILCEPVDTDDDDNDQLYIHIHLLHKLMDHQKAIMFKHANNSHHKIIEVVFDTNQTQFDYCNIYGDNRVAEYVLENRLNNPEVRYISDDDMERLYELCSEFLEKIPANKFKLSDEHFAKYKNETRIKFGGGMLVIEIISFH